MAVAKLGSVDPIAFLIPADELRRALAGRVGALDVTLQSINKGTADLYVNARLVDPKGMVSAVMVHVGRRTPNRSSLTATAPGRPYATPKGSSSAQPRYGSASGRIQVALGEQAHRRQGPHPDSAPIPQRSARLLEPKAYDLPEKPGRIYPTGTPLQLILKAARRESFAQLEPLVDPDKDCQLEKDDASDRVKIEVPGDKLHTLAPDVVTRLDKNKPLHNAPMTLAPSRR